MKRQNISSMKPRRLERRIWNELKLFLLFGGEYMTDEKMEYPASIYEFLLDYSFKDEDEIYTNGSLLIPTNRVKQAIEHYFENKALEVELLTDKEQRIFLKAMSREREICKQLDDEYDDKNTTVSLVKICNEIERKVKKIWE